MRRRTILAAIATFALPLAGCLGESETPGGDADARTDGGDTMDEPDDAGGPAPTVRSASLSAVDACPEASVRADGDEVVCRGCVRGRNGCTVAVLDGAAYDPGADELRVVVATEEHREEGAMCTQAIVRLGYEVTVALDEGLPGTVTLLEADVDGSREVLTASL
jgi:hypothetical protein